jgi:hypothetical protein
MYPASKCSYTYFILTITKPSETTNLPALPQPFYGASTIGTSTVSTTISTHVKSHVMKPFRIAKAIWTLECQLALRGLSTNPTE